MPRKRRGVRQSHELQKMLRMYKEETSATDVRMVDVASWAQQRGWLMPVVPTPVELLAKQLSKAAREETRVDLKTGQPYRVNHAYKAPRDGELLTFWIDIDERPPRDKMDKSLKLRREQMVGDALQLTLDANHWNSINPDEEPIRVELDFTDDVAWRINAPPEAPSEQRKAS